MSTIAVIGLGYVGLPLVVEFGPHDPQVLREADFIIVGVPTPVDEAHLPDFGPLAGPSRTIGPHLKPGAIVIYESTVYPGRYRGSLHPGARTGLGQGLEG